MGILNAVESLPYNLELTTYDFSSDGARLIFSQKIGGGRQREEEEIHLRKRRKRWL